MRIYGGFERPLTMPMQPPFVRWVGWNSPPPAVPNSLISQPYNLHLINSFRDAAAFRSISAFGSTPSDLLQEKIPERRIAEALVVLADGKTEAAGALFRSAREALELGFVTANLDAELFIGSAMGEAFWFKEADDSTYRALDIAENSLAYTSGGDLEAFIQLAFARATLVSRTSGDYGAAIESLNCVLYALIEKGKDASVDESIDDLAIQVNLGVIDLSLKTASISHGTDRASLLVSAAKVIAELEKFILLPISRRIDPNHALARTHSSGEEGDYSYFTEIALRAGASREDGIAIPKDKLELITGLYELLISLAAEMKYFYIAHENARTLMTRYPRSAAAARIGGENSPIKQFLHSNGTLMDFERTLTLSKRFTASAKEFLHHAVMPDSKSYLKLTALGSMAGIGISLLSGSTDFQSMLFWISGGATAAHAAGKVFHGLSAPETAEAFSAGYSQSDHLTDASKRILELGGTFALFGGVIPGAGLLEDLGLLSHLLANSDGYRGSFNGLGSLYASLSSFAASNVSDAIGMISNHGFSEGLISFWNDFSSRSVFGSALESGAKFWSGHGVSGDFSGLFAMNDWWSLYRSASVTWSASTMAFPSLRERAMKLAPMLVPLVELGMLPGIFDFAVDLGTALDVDLYHAKRIALIGMGMQVLFHTMSGGSIKNIDVANMGRGALVEQLYAGVGGKISPALMPEGFSGLFAASMGVQIMLAPIMAAHGILAKFNQHRMWQNKLLRSFSAESIGNFMRLALGWNTWQGTLASGLMQAFVQCPWMTRVAQEPAGSSPQRGAFLSAIKPPVKTSGAGQAERDAEILKSADDLLKQAQVAGRRWPFLLPLTGKTLVERFPMFLALYFTWAKKPEPFDTYPEEKYYRMIYRALDADNKNALSAEHVKWYLSMLDVITRDLDPELRDVRANLLVATYAAIKGPHREAIEDFFKNREWLFDHYGISWLDENDLPTKGGILAGHHQSKWFRENLISKSSKF